MCAMPAVALLACHARTRTAVVLPDDDVTVRAAAEGLVVRADSSRLERVQLGARDSIGNLWRANA
jgi:hypothetical protein